MSVSLINNTMPFVALPQSDVDYRAAAETATVVPRVISGQVEGVVHEDSTIAVTLKKLERLL